MAGETTKTARLTARDAGSKGPNKLVGAQLKVAVDTYQFAAATSLEAGDNLIMDIPLPSNCVVHEISIYNDDMDTNACPTLVLDVGVAAAQEYIDTTSGTKTYHAKDAIIDADLFVDGSTAGQAATTNWTVLLNDSATNGPEDTNKAIWELLGYDEDPRTVFNVVVQSQAASATLGSAADMSIRVLYSVN